MTGDNKPLLVSEGPYFSQLWESVLFDHELKPSDVCVYACLQRYAMEQGSEAVFPSQQEIGDRLNMNRDTVSDSLKRLAERKHITREMQGTRWVVTLKSPKPMRKNSAQVRKNSALNAEKPGIPTSNRENKEMGEEKSPTKRGSRLPEDWEPTEALREWVINDLGLTQQQLAFHTEKFCNYWWGKAGQQAIKVRWDLTYKNWMMEESQKVGTKINSNGYSARPLNNDEKRPIPSGMPEYLSQPAKSISPDKLSELRAMRGKS